MASIEKLNIVINAKDNASKTMKGLQKSTFSLKKAVAGLATTYAAIKLKDFVMGTVKAFQAQESAEKRLTQISKEVLGATDAQVQSMKDYAASMQEVGVIGDEILIQGQSQLASFGLTTEQIKQLTGGMGDLLVADKGVNVSLQDSQMAANKLGKAIATGLLGPLQISGVLLTDQQKALFKVADQTERTAILTEVLRQNYGGLNESMAETTEGAMKRASNAWGDFQEKIGSVIAPILADIAEFMVEMLGHIEDGMANLKMLWDEDWGGIRTTVEGFVEFVQTEVLPFIQNLWDIIKIGVGATQVIWGTTWEIMKLSLKTVWDTIMLVLRVAWEIVSGIIETGLALLTGDWEGAWEAIAGIFTGMWDAMGDYLQGAIDNMMGFINGMIERIQSAIQWVRDLISTKDEASKKGPTMQSINTRVSANKALGGKVSAGSAVTVGELGREVFVPSQNGSIIPNNKLGGGGGTTINLNFNGIVSSREVAEEYADMMVGRLKLATKVV